MPSGCWQRRKAGKDKCAFRVIKRFGLPIRARAEVNLFLTLMQKEELVAIIVKQVLAMFCALENKKGWW